MNGTDSACVVASVRVLYVRGCFRVVDDSYRIVGIRCAPKNRESRLRPTGVGPLVTPTHRDPRLRIATLSRSGCERPFQIREFLWGRSNSKEIPTQSAYGEWSPTLPCHTTRHAGPHLAVP